MFLCTGSGASPSGISYGSESSRSLPSFTLTIRVAYWYASSGLWVTMTTSRSLATSFSRSITWILVSLSRAPVGSSARRISGLFTRARARDTRCIWPPDIWFGFLWICSPKPTSSSALMARSRRSFPEIPEIVKASSTFANTVWCGIRL